MDMSQIMALLIGQGQRWVKEQRQAFRGRGAALVPQRHGPISAIFRGLLAPGSPVERCRPWKIRGSWRTAGMI